MLPQERHPIVEAVAPDKQSKELKKDNEKGRY
jgi:hypothetical protein